MNGNEIESLGVIREAFCLANLLEVGADVLVRDGVEVEALNTRENCLGNLLRIGCAQHKHNVSGRFFKRLEQGIKSLRREHVNLIDDVDLVGTLNRGIVDASNDLLADIVDTRATCRVELVDVRVLTSCNEATLLAGTVGQLTCTLLAEQGLGEDACHRCFASTARTTEQIRMARAAFANCMFERRDNVFLAYDLLEGRRAILAIERFHEHTFWPQEGRSTDTSHLGTVDFQV